MLLMRIVLRAVASLNLRYDVPFITKIIENVIVFGGSCDCAY